MHTQDMEQEGVGDMAIRVVMSEQLLDDINYMDRPELRGKNLFDGKIINISSMMGRVALPTQGAYASSKGAVEQLTNVLALEWAQAGVQVNAIAPAYCETPLTQAVFNDPERHRFVCERTPMGRWGQPYELAGAVIFLASDASSFVTGHVLKVDGGWNAW